MGQSDFLLTVFPDDRLDIDIVNGIVVEVPEPVDINTQRQRAAVSAYIAKGSIPGQETLGADWAGFLSGSVSLMECDNQVKATMETFAQVSQLADNPYPLYQKTGDGGMEISLLSIPKVSAPGGSV